jgi:hypothetical protein
MQCRLSNGGNMSLTVQNIEETIKKHFPNSSIVVRHSEGRTGSLFFTVRFALLSSAEWTNKLFHNDPVASTFLIFEKGDDKYSMDTLYLVLNVAPDPQNPKEKHLAFGKVKQTVRKVSGSGDDVLKTLSAGFKKFAKLVLDNKERIKEWETIPAKYFQIKASDDMKIETAASEKASAMTVDSSVAKKLLKLGFKRGVGENGPGYFKKTGNKSMALYFSESPKGLTCLLKSWDGGNSMTLSVERKNWSELWKSMETHTKGHFEEKAAARKSAAKKAPAKKAPAKKAAPGKAALKKTPEPDKTKISLTIDQLFILGKTIQDLVILSKKPYNSERIQKYLTNWIAIHGKPLTLHLLDMVTGYEVSKYQSKTPLKNLPFVIEDNLWSSVNGYTPGAQYKTEKRPSDIEIPVVPTGSQELDRIVEEIKYLTGVSSAYDSAARNINNTKGQNDKIQKIMYNISILKLAELKKVVRSVIRVDAEFGGKNLEEVRNDLLTYIQENHSKHFKKIMAYYNVPVRDKGPMRSNDLWEAVKLYQEEIREKNLSSLGKRQPREPEKLRN